AEGRVRANWRTGRGCGGRGVNEVLGVPAGAADPDRASGAVRAVLADKTVLVWSADDLHDPGRGCAPLVWPGREKAAPTRVEEVRAEFERMRGVLAVVARKKGGSEAGVPGPDHRRPYDRKNNGFPPHRAINSSVTRAGRASDAAVVGGAGP
ncbi:hypothetical protein, partial [Streptomyces hirsutus]|uniref:hypothetical protein n=1 Tax=Streptomyces hirsutus TaxID=35620 RepID=UPI000AB8154B